MKTLLIQFVFVGGGGGGLNNVFLWGGGGVNKVYLYFGQYLHVLVKNLVKNCFLRITCKFLCFAL